MPRVPGPKTLGPGVITYAQTGCQAMQEPHTLTHRPKLASERPHFPRPRNEDLHRTPSRRGSLSAGSYTSNHNLHRTPLRKAYFRPGATPPTTTSIEHPCVKLTFGQALLRPWTQSSA